MELRGTSGIVTGASRGLGRLIAVALAERGVNLALAARSEDGIRETLDQVRRFGVDAVPVRCDVTNDDDLQRLVDTTVEELGPPDLLVNNAGVEAVADYRDMPTEEIRNLMTTNAISPMLLSRMVIPHMARRKSGHIVNISSLAGKGGMPYFAAYASSKHALVGFSWCLRQEMSQHGIGVSVICPGFIQGTGMADEWELAEKRPVLVRNVAPEKVVKAVLTAIDKNKAEIVVAPGLSVMSDVFFAIAPDLTSRVLRAGGVHKYFATEARLRPRG